MYYACIKTIKYGAVMINLYLSEYIGQTLRYNVSWRGNIQAVWSEILNAGLIVAAMTRFILSVPIVFTNPSLITFFKKIVFFIDRKGCLGLVI